MLSCKNNVFVRKAVSQGYQGYFLNPKKEVKEEVKEEEVEVVSEDDPIIIIESEVPKATSTGKL